MTRDASGKLVADKSHDWLDTWKSMEDVYLANRDKVKAIGMYRLIDDYIPIFIFFRCLQLFRGIP